MRMLYQWWIKKAARRRGRGSNL